VSALDIEFASQISISVQQDPVLPRPVFALFVEGVHPTTLA
jgi:hypothetical protein